MRRALPVPPLRNRALVVRAHLVRALVVRALVLTALALTALSSSACSPVADDLGTEPVVHEVIDGDTIVVMFPTGNAETVRLLGVDTPETVDPTRPKQCFGAEASAFVAALIPPGTQIRLERDLEPRDRYGRLLAYVFRADNGQFVNAELLEHGMADLSIYSPNDGYADVLRAKLRQAKTTSAGLWNVCGGPDVAIDPPPVQN